MGGLVTKSLRGVDGRQDAGLGERMLSRAEPCGLVGREEALSSLGEADGFFAAVFWDGRRGRIAADRARALLLCYREGRGAGGARRRLRGPCLRRRLFSSAD